jgi:hypothetical protein
MTSSPNMALQRTRRPRFRSGRSLRSLGSPLNARSLGAGRQRWTVIVALFIGLSSAACHTGPSFAEYQQVVEKTAGSDAMNCGLVRLGSSREPGLSCLRTALSNRRPAFVIFQVRGIDSDIFLALATDQSGRATQLLWDSDVRGSGSRFFSKSRIESRPCVEPSLVEDKLPFRCGEKAGA